MVTVYCGERQARRRFLERLMISSQQDKIIEHKARNERLQRDVLQHVLPDFIVEHYESKGIDDVSWASLVSWPCPHAHTHVQAHTPTHTDVRPRTHARKTFPLLTHALPVTNMRSEIFVHASRERGDHVC